MDLSKISIKTYYAMGVVSAALTVLGGVILMTGHYMVLIYNIATLVGGAMFLLLAAAERADKRGRTFYFLALVGMICSLVPGIIGKFGGALAWPLFAYPCFVRESEESLLRKSASLVMIAGVVQLVGSFLLKPRMLAACISVILAAIQGVFAYLLFKDAQSAVQE